MATTSNREELVNAIDDLLIRYRDNPELIKDLVALRAQISYAPQSQTSRLAMANIALRLAALAEWIYDHWPGGHGPHQ